MQCCIPSSKQSEIHYLYLNLCTINTRNISSSTKGDLISFIVISGKTNVVKRLLAIEAMEPNNWEIEEQIVQIIKKYKQLKCFSVMFHTYTSRLTI